MPLNEIKSRFAEQRARGAETRVSEEEEDMILEALGRLRRNETKSNVKPDASSGFSGEDVTLDGRVLSEYGDSQDSGSRLSTSPSFLGGQSVRSTTTTTSSLLHNSTSNASMSSAKGSQASRRQSNNLFGSGKHHDHTYIRTARERRGGVTSSGHSSVKYSDSNTSMSTITSSRVGNSNSIYSDAPRPVTPESSSYAGSAPSSPGSNANVKESTSTLDAKTDLIRALSPEALKRASIALDAVIRELEEEQIDEIVMERSPISTTPRVNPTTIPRTIVCTHESFPSCKVLMMISIHRLNLLL